MGSVVSNESQDGCDNIDNENDKDAGYSQPIYTNGRFHNPWPTWRDTVTVSNMITFTLKTRNENNIPGKAALDQTLPVLTPDLNQFHTSPAQGVRFMWLGHASCLVQLDGVTLLTDPVFSDRCSPLQILGPRRYRPTPCSVQELPDLDCVVISHNHYDHLDYHSVVALNNRYGDKLTWYVPVGLQKWMNDRGCRNVVQLSWWQANTHNSGVTFISTPCQHWCKRTVADTNKVLWTSWCVKGPTHSFFFAGDTGYCPAFKEIGQRLGPFTVSAIPIGAYHPRSVLAPQHVDPAQAVDIHTDVRSQHSVGIHWGTFSLSKEFYLEPRELLKEEVQKRGLVPTSFITSHHGDIITLGGQ